LSVSGVLCPITKTRSSQTRLVTKLDGFETIKVAEAQPETSFTTTRFTYINNLNDQYCTGEDCFDLGFAGQSIADGPVVAAQEIEHFSSFLSGFNRSRITVLSDSAFVQGRCLGDEFFRASPESVNFIRSLYPETFFPNTSATRSFNTISKIISPERGSPQKYYYLSQQSGINNLFGGFSGGQGQSLFNNIESQYDPNYVIDPESPFSIDLTPEEKEIKKRNEISKFAALQSNYRATAKFSGIIDGSMYSDVSYKGGMPLVMKNLGYDYLDENFMPNSYKGDLFGYSIGLSKNKLIVGSPGSAFKNATISDWNYNLTSSGLSVGYDGGAGAVYIFEKTLQGSGYYGLKEPWECTQKLRPISINIGSSGSPSDKFGSSLSISSDIIAVGAPHHDYGNRYINTSGEFIRKSFNPEFTIPERKVTELNVSGLSSMGAVFMFENAITDWSNKTKNWILVEKLTSEMFGRSGVNDQFGRHISIDRANRSDADYSVGISSKKDVGRGYTCDIMIREQLPSIPSPESYIHAKAFGEIDQNWQPNVFMAVKNNRDNEKKYFASGIIYADKKGQIFLEASGQDPVAKGFIQHRPFIKSLNGQYAYGTPNSGNFPLVIEGMYVAPQENMNLFTRVDDSANVYNSLGLYNGAIIGFASGIPSGLNLYIDCPDPIAISESGLCLYAASGIGTAIAPLNMRIRGK
jgi:hypothetical protein